MGSPVADRFGLNVVKPMDDQVYVFPSDFGMGGQRPGDYNNYQSITAMTQPGMFELLKPDMKIELKKQFAQSEWGNNNWEKVADNQMTWWWKDTLLRTQALQQATGLRISPVDYFPYMWAQDGVAGSTASTSGSTASTSGGGGGGGPSTSTRIDLTDPSSAKALVNQALSTQLGRDANAKEIEAFHKALNIAQTKNPSIAQSDGAGNVVGSGGINAAQFAEDWALKQPGTAEFQKATTFLDSFINTIKSPVV